MSAPVDDERHEQAIEAAERAIDDYIELKGPKVMGRPRTLATKAIAAYFAELERQGVEGPVCPECDGEGSYNRLTAAWEVPGRPTDRSAAALTARLTVRFIRVPVDPCPRCGGSGHMGMYKNRDPATGPETACPECGGMGMANAAPEANMTRWAHCPRCGGSGVER